MTLPLGRAGSVMPLLVLSPGPGIVHGRTAYLHRHRRSRRDRRQTQLLAILLATRFRKPVPIILGILVATLANHACAAFLGASVASIFTSGWFQTLVAISFLAMAAWTLIPDKIDDLDDKPARFGAFLTTAIAFFLVEMGDKTQVATVALGARFQDVTLVTMGTTLGMMLANVPAVFLGEELVKRVPLKAVRIAAALLFAALGIWLLVGGMGRI